MSRAGRAQNGPIPASPSRELMLQRPPSRAPLFLLKKTLESDKMQRHPRPPGALQPELLSVMTLGGRMALRGIWCLAGRADVALWKGGKGTKRDLSGEGKFQLVGGASRPLHV